MYIASDGINTAVIQRDSQPMNPRDPMYQDNLGSMVCWHSRYSLGDDHAFGNAREFAFSLAEHHINERDLLAAVRAGDIKDLRLFELTDHFSIQNRGGLPGDQGWEPTGWRLKKDLEPLTIDNNDNMKEALLEHCTTAELISLCERSNQVAILPLYLYDHSCLSMSTISFVGRAQHAEWDSGIVGFIHMNKETAMKELVLPADTLKIAKMLSNEQSIPVILQKDVNQSVAQTLKSHGFLPIQNKNCIRNLYDPSLGSDGTHPLIRELDLNLGLVYKKDNKLYAFDGQKLDGSLAMKPLAVYNPDLLPLTEETWKGRAEEILNSEVAQYDNYLTGEVYGLTLYEGFNEIESSWGYFPGSKRIEDLFDDLLDGWHPELASKFDFKCGDDFDIEAHFDTMYFPELYTAIQKSVEEVLLQTAKSGRWPFEVSCAEIRNNKDGILENIIDTLYGEHELPTTAAILDELALQAGIARSIQTRITAADLDPNRDYTQAELMNLFKEKKNPLDHTIKAAQIKSAQQLNTRPANHHTREERPTL